MNHKLLDKEFTKKGFTFKEIKRDGDVAIYEKISKHGCSHYEVISIGRHNGYTLGGVDIEPSETYPSDSMWGLTGFTYTTLKEAEARMNTIKDSVCLKNKKSVKK